MVIPEEFGIKPWIWPSLKPKLLEDKSRSMTSNQVHVFQCPKRDISMTRISKSKLMDPVENVADCN